MGEIDRIAAVLERALVDLRLPKRPRRKIPVKAVKTPEHVEVIKTPAEQPLVVNAPEHIEVVISMADIMDILKVLGAKIDQQGLDIKALRKYLRLTPEAGYEELPPVLPQLPTIGPDPEVPC